MITAQVEPFMARVEELKALLGNHYQELALNKDKVPLSPQWHVYDAREKNGEICFVTLRESGRMIGYIILFVTPGLHYSTCLTAIMDIAFVSPDFRDPFGKGFLKMMDCAEAELKRRGVKRWFMGTKIHKNISMFFKRRQFDRVEETWCKWIGD
jgi:hypothetical protein